MKHSLYIISLLLLMSACVPQNVSSPSKSKSAAVSPPVALTEETSVPSLGKINADIPTIKVGFLVPLSGESENIGNMMMDAASLALYDSYLAVPSEQIRTQIVLVPQDTGSTPAGASDAAKQVIAEGAGFVIGPLFSQSVSAVAPILKEKNISMISFSNNKAVASSGVYTFGFLPEQQVERIAEYAYLHKLQRVALLAPNDAYGEKVRDTLGDVYLKKSGRIPITELYAPSAANIDAAVTRLAGAYNNTPEDRRFQAIFIADSGNQMRNIMSSLAKNSINLKKVKLLGAGLIDDSELAQIPEMQGMWFPSSPPDSYKKFENRFMQAYGYKPARVASLAYDATTIIARVAMSGNGIKSSAIIGSNGFISPANGLVRLSSGGSSERKLAIMEVVSDGFKVIEPAHKAFSNKSVGE